MMPQNRFFICLVVMVMLYGMSKGSEPTELPPENVCYWAKGGYDKECPGRKEIATNFINVSSSGVVIAEVELPPISCDYEWFQVTLVDEKRRGDGTCTSGRHSLRTYQRIKCQSEKCPEDCTNVTKFVFYQVYTSNYSVTVNAYTVKNAWKTYTSTQREIKTNYLNSWGTDITYNIELERDIVNFQLTYTTPTSDIQIILLDEEYKNGDIIFFEVSNSTVKASLELKGDDDDVVGGHDILMKMCNITQEKQEKRHIGNINSVSCAYNTSESVKRLEIYFSNEELCDRMSRDTREAKCLCWGERTLEVRKKETFPDSTKYYNLYVSIFVIMSLVFGAIAAITIIAALRRRKWQHVNITEDPIINSMISNGTEVFLLYPRDCPEFMTLMSSLKNLLESNYEIKVHDCYDEDNMEILDGPEEWFQTLMNRSGLRIIVVTTECACLLQEAHLTYDTEIYRKPEFLDRFFMYALTYIKRDISRDVYHKIYTVQISGFSDDAELKFIPTALARYKLPDHLGKVLQDMSVVRSDEVLIEIENWKNGKAYEDLIKSLKELQLFKIRNDRYLHELLTLQEEQVA